MSWFKNLGKKKEQSQEEQLDLYATPTLSLQNLAEVSTVGTPVEEKKDVTQEVPAFDLPPYIKGLPKSFKSLLTEKQYKDMEQFVKTVVAPKTILDSDFINVPWKSFESKQAAELGY